MCDGFSSQTGLVSFFMYGGPMPGKDGAVETY
jgi:hypothetical protein